MGLDFFPDSPVVLELTGQPEVLEVPVMPTTIERAMQTLDRLVKRIEALDLEGLVASARHALDGVDNLARSPKVEDALDGLRDTLASIRRVTDALEPGVTPTMKGLDATLAQARQVLDPGGAAARPDAGARSGRCSTPTRRSPSGWRAPWLTWARRRAASATWRTSWIATRTRS